MVSDPFNPQQLLASSGQALYHSRDGGQAWQELKLYVPADKVVAIAFSPRTRDQFWIALKEVGIFVSDDGGEVWSELEALPFDPVAGEYIEHLSVAANNLLTVKTRYGLYLQQENGWRSHRFPEINAAALNSAQDWIWRLHTGRGLGAWGLPLYDAIAISLIFLALSGLWLSFRPRRKPKIAKTQPTTQEVHA
jgi:ligand-binding sensor domain-containing protein